MVSANPYNRYICFQIRRLRYMETMFDTLLQRKFPRTSFMSHIHHYTGNGPRVHDFDTLLCSSHVRKQLAEATPIQ